MEAGSSGHRMKFLDLILFIYGFKLYANESAILSDSIQNYANIALRAVTAVIYYINIIVFIIITKHDDWFMSVSFLCKYIIFIAFHHYFWYRMNKFKDLFDDISSFMETFEPKYEPAKITSKGFLKLWSLATVAALAMTFQIISFDYKTYSKYDQRNQKEDLIKAIFTTIIMNIIFVLYNFGWLLCTFIFFSYIYFLLKELNDNTFKFVKNLSSTSDDEQLDSITKFRIKRFILQELKARVNVLLGVFPFLWFLFIFIEGCWLIIATNFASLSRNWGEIGNRITFIIYLVVVTFFVQKVNSDECKSTDTLLGELKTNADDSDPLTSEKMACVTEITDSPVIPCKIFNLIPLKYFTLLALLGFIIPTGVLVRIFSSSDR